MAISKSKNKRNLAKRKARKLKELNFITNRTATIISVVTQEYANKLEEYLNTSK